MKRLALAFVLAVLLTACGNSYIARGPVTTPQPTRHVYVAIGASESVGIGADNVLRDGWTKVFWNTALPPNTVFDDIANTGSTANDAVNNQLALAISAKPDYVTVWLNVNDIIGGVPVADYQASMATILQQLHTQTKAKVLVANTPPLDQMPAYVAARNGQLSNDSPFFDRGVPLPQTLDATVAAYNTAIANLAKQNGDTLVDLYSLGETAISNGTWASTWASDGYHPSTAGHAAIGNAFAAAFKLDAGPTTR